MSIAVANRGFHSTSRRLEKLFGKIRSVNFLKTKMTKGYQNWEERVVEVINTLKEIRQYLEKSSNTANIVKIGGQVSTILGCVVSICGMLTVNNKNVSETFERVGSTLTVAGTITTKGSTVVEKLLTNDYCKQAKRAMDTLTKITEELEADRKAYFRLIQEYSASLDELYENELEIIYNFLKENNTENIEYDAHLDPSVENEIPPNMEKIRQLKLDEDAMNEKISEFNLMPEISAEMRNNPVLKQILSMKCQSLPFVSGENAMKAIQSASTALDLLPINSKLGKLQDSVFIAGSAKILRLVDSICSLVLTVSNRGQVSEQCKEIERVANELEQYRSDVKILSETLQWNCFEDDSLCVADGNINKRD